MIIQDMCFNYTDYSFDGDQVKVISFVLDFPTVRQTGKWYFHDCKFHTAQRSGQGEERTVVSKCLMWTGNVANYIHKLTCLLK